MSILTPSTVSLTASRTHDHLCLPAGVTTIDDVIVGQVEMKRVGIPAYVPCAVQQWEGLIAGEILLHFCRFLTSA